jgi:hypothetical protein
MTINVPIWLQNGTYPARLDRAFIERVLHGSQRVFDGLEVTQTGSGSATVDIAVGAAAILGGDENNQGMYFVDVIAEETSNSVTTPTGARTDIVVLRVNDPTANGPAGDNATIELIEGTTVPDTAILLATIARTAGAPILDADITDSRPLGPYPYGVGTSGPPLVGVEGDLYIQVA